MNLLLMTTPYFFVEEHRILTALFDEGLDILHLRKPETEPVYSERLLSLLPESYRKRIVVHDHFYLKNEYRLKGIHLSHRNPQLPVGYKGHISCSCHTIEEVVQHKKSCNYVLLTPVFDVNATPESPTEFTPELLKEYAKQKFIDKKVMAMGGIDLENIRDVKSYGFGGAVLLGAIWNRFDPRRTQDFKELIYHFRKLRKAAE